MAQLIITIFAIALTAAVAMATISYAPWWYRSADTAEAVAVASLRIMEQAYDVAARANNGTPPAVMAGEADGGFALNFEPVLKVLPPAAPRFSWKYGHANGLDYFCMESTGSPVGQGTARGLLRATSVFSPTQVYLDTTCGTQTNLTPMPDAPTQLALTMYVAFVPGISR